MREPLTAEAAAAACHPAQSQLERFLRGELTRAEARQVVRHLLTGCPSCVAVARRVWRLGDFEDDKEIRCSSWKRPRSICGASSRR